MPAAIIAAPARCSIPASRVAALRSDACAARSLPPDVTVDDDFVVEIAVAFQVAGEADASQQDAEDDGAGESQHAANQIEMT